MRRADDVRNPKTCKTLLKTSLAGGVPIMAVELLWNRFCNRVFGAEGAWVECTEENREKFEEWLNEEV